MGGKYKSLIPHLTNQEIQTCFNCVYTHQQNRVSERKHRLNTDFALTLLSQTQIPLQFWLEAF